MILAGGRHDERSHGLMYVPRDSDYPPEGEGRGEGVGAKGADGLEKGLVQQS